MAVVFVALNPIELLFIIVASIGDIFRAYASGKRPEKGETFIWWLTMFGLWRITVRMFYHMTGTDIEDMVSVGLLTEKDLNLSDEELIRKVQGIRKEFFEKYVGGAREQIFWAVDKMTWYDGEDIRKQIRQSLKK
jgi:hypothetical protein